MSYQAAARGSIRSSACLNHQRFGKCNYFRLQFPCPDSNLIKNDADGSLLKPRATTALSIELQNDLKYAHQSQMVLQQNRMFSSEATSYSPLNWWRGRQEKKQNEDYKKRVGEMAEMEVFTIGVMHSELEQNVKSWAAKLAKNEETAAAKKMHQILSGIVAVVGKDATADRLQNMTRKEKLEAAIAGETTVEEINITAKQVESMSLMHSVLRSQRLAGKPIPETAEAMQTLVQTKAVKFISKEKKKQLGLDQARAIMRKRR